MCEKSQPSTCQNCGKLYYVKHSRKKVSKFCSYDCKNKAASINQHGRAMPAACIKEAFGDHTRLGFAKKCGHLTKKGRSYCASCRDHIYPKHVKSCKTCGKEIILASSEAKKYKCCSLKCRNVQISKRQKGENSHFWKGGLTEVSRIQRNSADYDNWRKSVFDRDCYTCQSCGQLGGKLCADHIKEWSLYPALRFDIDNGRTLCFPCHQKTENFGYRAYEKIRKLEVSGTLQYRLL